MDRIVALTFSALIVDDNEYNRQIFQFALESVDYITTVVDSGFSALAALEHQTFDLMVLDLHMPVMNGEVVLRKVRSMPMSDSMKIIIATANPHMAIEDVERLADYIVFKPVDLAQFTILVKRLKNSARSAYT